MKRSPLKDWDRFLNKVLRRLDPILLFSSENYKVHAEIGTSPHHLHHTGAVLDTGAGPNCIRADILPPNWEAWNIPNLNSGPVDAQGNRVEIVGITSLYVRLGSQTTRTHFLVCKSLAVPMPYPSPAPSTGSYNRSGPPRDPNFRSYRYTSRIPTMGASGGKTDGSTDRTTHPPVRAGAGRRHLKWDRQRTKISPILDHSSQHGTPRRKAPQGNGNRPFRGPAPAKNSTLRNISGRCNRPRDGSHHRNTTPSPSPQARHPGTRWHRPYLGSPTSQVSGPTA